MDETEGRPTRQELAAFTIRIEDAVREVTGINVEAIDNPHPSAEDALRVLRVLTWARTALTTLEAHAAQAAAQAGATYADLGRAAGLTKQGARHRWPHALPHARPGRPPLPPTTDAND